MDRERWIKSDADGAPLAFQALGFAEMLRAKRSLTRAIPTQNKSFHPQRCLILKVLHVRALRGR